MHTRHFSASTLVWSAVVLFWILAVCPLRAFPPAPGYTVYGMLRDEFGWVVDSPDARILLKDKRTNALIASGEIRSDALLTENFRIMLPLDHFQTLDPYKLGAVDTTASFFVVVTVGGNTYYPITAQSSVEAGGFHRLDLALGDDTDGDGLPDAWEAWQLDTAGLPSDRLDLLDRDGDVDGDGASNFTEFISGTFVYLRTDVLRLKFKPGEPIEAWAVFEFLAVIGKTYVIERSLDLGQWSVVRFGMGEDRSTLVSETTAAETRWQTIQVPTDGRKQWFYRVRVR